MYYIQNLACVGQHEIQIKGFKDNIYIFLKYVLCYCCYMLVVQTVIKTYVYIPGVIRINLVSNIVLQSTFVPVCLDRDKRLINYKMVYISQINEQF